jgi:hypothetical protein
VEVGKLLNGCKSPGAKLAIALAAFSGLQLGQVRGLSLGKNVVGLPLPQLKFAEVPARIELWSRVTQRRAVHPHKWYTFLSTRACGWLLEDLKVRSQPVSTKATVVTSRSFKEADRVVHAAGLRWHDLRDFFAESFIHCFVTMGTGSVDLRFLLGHSIDENVLTHVWRFYDPQRIKWMRARYAQVEKQYFV